MGGDIDGMDGGGGGGGDSGDSSEAHNCGKKKNFLQAGGAEHGRSSPQRTQRGLSLPLRQS